MKQLLRRCRSSISRLRYRPTLIALSEPATDPMPLQGPAKMVRLYLHPEFLAEVAADLFGRGLLPKRLYGAKCGITQ